MSLNYFNKLNYTLANEDTSLELNLLAPNTNHVLSVAGSGGRVLPLLAKHPKKLTCVDLSPEQLYLTEARLESVRVFTHEEFLAFWGYNESTSPKERKNLFKKLSLSQRANTFLTELFEHKSWQSILYEGKWERTFSKLASFNQKLTRKRGADLFQCQSMQEQKNYIQAHFPHWAWKMVLFLMGNAAVFNSLLYKGHFPKKNIPDSLYRFYVKSFNRLFDHSLARNNFFLQIVFFGKILYEDGHPIECDPKVYEEAKKALQTVEIDYVSGNIVEVASQSKIPIDFVSFSDVPSYFSGKTEKNFMQKISKGLASNATVVIRYYLRVAEDVNLSGYENMTHQWKDEIDQEKVQVYTVEIYKKKEAP